VKDGEVFLPVVPKARERCQTCNLDWEKDWQCQKCQQAACRWHWISRWKPHQEWQWFRRYSSPPLHQGFKNTQNLTWVIQFMVGSHLLQTR